MSNRPDAAGGDRRSRPSSDSPPTDAGPTVAQYLTETWLPAVKVALRPGTWSSYSDHVHMHIVRWIGDIPLDQLDPTDINAFYGRLLNRSPKPLAPSTVRRVHATLHRAMRDAKRWGLLAQNPVSGVDRPWVPQKEMPAWEPAQLRTFLTAAREDPRYELWLFYALTGVRRGEALGLRWSDVDLAGQRVSVRRSLLVVEHQLHVGELKTARGRRTISIDSYLTAALTRLRRRQRERGLGRDGDLVFARDNGLSWNPEQVTRWFKQLAHRAGLPPIRLHGVRHSHATSALAAGVDVKIVSIRLGHSRSSITADIYQHALPGLDREAAQRMADLIVPPDDDHPIDGDPDGNGVVA